MGPDPVRVVIAGGGTGGHLYPGLAVARALGARDSRVRVSFAGTTRGLEARVLPREGFEVDFIRSAGLKGKSLADRIRGAVLLAPSLLDAWRVVSVRRPDLVVGVGGYSSGPVVMIAAARGVPTLVLEQNAVPGLTNRLLARVVRAAAVTYESTLPYFRGKGFVAGNPVRSAFFGCADRSEAGRGGHRVLVFGGSQGAHAINVAMISASATLAECPDLTITHQTGDRDLELVREAYARAGLRARVEPFLYAMDEEMGHADLVVCRAGATTLAELSAASRPALLVPLPTATDDHQRVNASVLADAGAAVVIEQHGLSGESLAGEILTLVRDPERLRQMAIAMRGFSRPQAAERIVDRAFELLAPT